MKDIDNQADTMCGGFMFLADRPPKRPGGSSTSTPSSSDSGVIRVVTINTDTSIMTEDPAVWQIPDLSYWLRMPVKWSLDQVIRHVVE
jgi:hypothetical protein